MTISHHPGNRLDRVWIIACLGAIAAATLEPQWGAPKPDVRVLCVLCGDLGGPDLVLNILLFMPLGFFLSRAGWHPARIVAAAIVGATMIEVVQVWLPGRSSTVRDVACNAAGAGVGALIALRGRRWIGAGRGAALRLAAAVAFVVGAVAATGWSVRFAPSAPPYFAHWSPRQAHLEHWTGRVTRATVDGVAVPFGPVVAAEALRDSITDGVEIHLEGVGGARTRELGGIFTISDARMREVLLVGPEGADLVVRVRRHAADVRFDAPVARFPRLMLGAEDATPFTMRVVASPARTCATVNGTTQCTGRPAAGSAWRALRAVGDASPTARILLDASTLASLAFLVGLLLRAVAPYQAVAATMALVAGVPAAAHLTGLRLPGPAEWAGLGAGLVAGILLNRLVSTGGADHAALDTGRTSHH